MQAEGGYRPQVAVVPKEEENPMFGGVFSLLVMLVVVLTVMMLNP